MLHFSIKFQNNGHQPNCIALGTMDIY